MAPSKKQLGVGAVVSSLARFVHPSEYIREAFPNMEHKHRLHGCLVVRMEVKKVTGKDQLCLVVTHVDFKKADGSLIELHAVKGHWRIHKEGERDLFFDSAAVPASDAEVEFSLPPEIADKEATEESILEALTDVVEIDDDNQPLPENIPNIDETIPSILADNWGHDGICFRKQAEVGQGKARLLFHVDPKDEFLLLKIFEGLFPKAYLETVLIVETNKKLDGRPLTYGELLKWIGMWVIMSTVDGSSRRSFWSLRNPIFLMALHSDSKST
jgi:hypothetical protein